MSAETAQNARGSGGASLFSDQRFRSLFFQALVIGLLGAFLVFIVFNTAHNIEKRGIQTGFAFLDTAAGYDIAISPFMEYTATHTHGRVFLVGLLNTLMVSFLGIIAATILGVFLGVLRLSPNWLVSRIVYWYIEFTRNVPLLLQILLWYAVFLGLPAVKKSITLFNDTFILNKRGLIVPEPLPGDGFMLVPVMLVVAIVASILFARWAKKKQAATGKIYPVFMTNTAMIVGLPLLAFAVTGFPLDFAYAELKGFNFKGGVVIKPEFTALWFALSLYTAAFVAETVRAGIQSVSHGQTEASEALGLRPSWTMRLIILPQALRVIIPPMTSQYLNLTKNSSLAVAIGYPDIVQSFGGVTLNQTGQAIEVIFVTMLVYLTISLLISAFMNWYNNRVRLVER
ncbi:amino acid ABC transporter permease [Kiloniella litopenaei]|uniref:Amino acid ABC transporter permease n=1 Tax=Kiloniella litopenaei TaxID=1549748 RepID=A0A0M2R4Y5_9PROT|nr:amino acid ABC transporter permease [Kiloniella litopenaei]KKJ75519.1 amino acid ABC transporter permease [Kiloniella litopenaei]